MIENNVNTWAEAIASLPDKQFFSMMRLYLGEIKTPYNKQRLVQQLAVFIRQPANSNNIITLLDEFDIKVLTAISLISNVTQDNITDFFKNKYSHAEIFTEIINLKERLIIYSDKDSITGKEQLLINPLLLENITPYLDINQLFPIETAVQLNCDDIFTISPNFIAALITYIKIRSISCKADGNLKKNDITRLEQIFPGKIDCIQLLVTAFINLSILVNDTKSLNLDQNKLESFSNLPLMQQYAFLCAASVSRFSRDGLKKEAQLLLDCLNSIPETGYTTQTLLWLAFLAGSYSREGCAVTKQSRFSQLLQQAKASQEANNNADTLDLMISSAISFGLLQKKGTNEEGNPIYIRGNLDQLAIPESSFPQENLPKVVNIDSTFTVTIMPGLPLSHLLPLTSFMNIKKSGVVTEFEISKQSVSMGFDSGLTPEDIYKLISNYSYYELPQNLKINIEGWYKSYSSAVIYHGFILKVTDNNIKIAENNPKIKKYLKEKLAEGIYLLNLPPDTNINFFKDESGLEFLGDVKTFSKEQTASTFPLLQKSMQLQVLQDAAQKSYKQISISEAENLLKQIKDSLSTKEMDAHKKETLEHKVQNRMILSPEQLDIAAVRTEILEADGMDFSGKLHLIDVAIKEEDLLELQMPDARGNFVTIIGRPLTLTKQVAEALLQFQLEPDGFVDNILVSRITHIKRLRF